MYTVVVLCASRSSVASEKWKRVLKRYAPSHVLPNDYTVVYVGEGLDSDRTQQYNMTIGAYASDATTPAADLVIVEFCPLNPAAAFTAATRAELGEFLAAKLHDDARVVFPYPVESGIIDAYATTSLTVESPHVLRQKRSGAPVVDLAR